MLDEQINALVKAANVLSAKNMTDAHLKIVLDKKSLIEQWLNDVESYAKERMLGV
jgi:hypothetical protein